MIEAIETPDARFCVGVQWHPENFWRTGEFAPLFDAFVGAARERLSGATAAGRHGSSAVRRFLAQTIANDW